LPKSRVQAAQGSRGIPGGQINAVLAHTKQGLVHAHSLADLLTGIGKTAVTRQRARFWHQITEISRAPCPGCARVSQADQPAFECRIMIGGFYPRRCLIVGIAGKLERIADEKGGQAATDLIHACHRGRACSHAVGAAEKLYRQYGRHRHGYDGYLHKSRLNRLRGCASIGAKNGCDGCVIARRNTA